MKKIVSIASSAIVLALSGSAFAGGVDHMAPAATDVAPTSSSHFYVGVNGGYTMSSGDIESSDSAGQATKNKFSDSFDNGFYAGGEVGYVMTGALPVSFEVAGNYYSLPKKKDGAASGDFSAYDVMANVYYDLDMGQFSPYLGVGVGYANFTVKDGSPESAGGLAYQGLAGIEYKINDNIDFGLGYHLLANSIEFKSTGSTKKFSSTMLHSFDAGLRYHFV